MPTTPIHPAIVHIPLGLAFVLPILALGVFAAVRASKLPRMALAMILAIQVIVVGAAFAAGASGERDEERVEGRVAESVIEKHEDAAHAFQIAAVVGALLTATALFVRRESLARMAGWSAVAGTFVVAGLGVHVGHLGGQLVYAHGAAAAFAGASATASDDTGRYVAGREEGEHDDD